MKNTHHLFNGSHFVYLQLFRQNYELLNTHETRSICVFKNQTQNTVKYHQIIYGNQPYPGGHPSS